ncbi:aspartic peptidase domain-containing protein [Phyllosticta citrichinensis]|uniref:Aspartic peptidase domain-containing protein n=1 Tax=Phyllosticta citrichinensis TaxID=1130410 RepID=A0ABR1XTD7_9PEZI
MLGFFHLSLLLSGAAHAAILRIPIEWLHDSASSENPQRPQQLWLQNPLSAGQEKRGKAHPQDSLLTLELGIGTPAQKVRMVPDLTSNIFIIPTASCRAKARSRNRGREDSNVFKSNQSSTYLRGPTIPEISWGETLYRGHLARDVINFGQNGTWNKTFTEATWVHSRTHSRSAGPHGVFGLKFGRSFADSSSLFTGMVDAGHLDKKIFGVELPQGHNSGQLTLGGLDHGLRLEDVDMMPATPSETLGWAVEAKYLGHIDSGFSLVVQLENCTAELDFNFPGFAFPRPFLENILNALDSPPESGFTADTITFPCDHRQQLPIITIGLSQNEYKLTAFDYAYAIEDEENGQTMCAVRIHSGSVLSAQRGSCMVLGREFFSAFYSVFDVENMKVGFIKQSDF